MTGKILVSACLLGHKVRYDNGDVPCLDARFLKWYEEGRFVHICPEVVGGLSTPRPDAQRQGERVVNRCRCGCYGTLYERCSSNAEAGCRTSSYISDFKTG
ncbi:DUF523 domain-containing protein [Paenibacillus etheri]|uniref:DUF523 domain-containing protein n=1 Tax=Paenibacillus etheri TaxID=1306852 RepID=UPI0024765491|nr:DUF523 domain-containing protein [Paenibacillus etheri]